MKVKDLFVPIIVGGVALFGYDKYKSHLAERAELQASAATASAASQAPAQAPTAEDRSWIKPRDSEAGAGSALSGQFKCDGRTHCSQMTSCAEATYFIQHCPNTEMDGNHDGQPCEKQWCN